MASDYKKLGLRLFVNQVYNLGLRTSVENDSKTKLGVRIACKSPTFQYNSIGLRIFINKEASLGLRSSVVNTLFAKLGTRVGVEETTNVKGVGLRVWVNSAKDNLGLRFSIDDTKYIQKGIRVGVEETYNLLSEPIIKTLPNQILGLRVWINKQSDLGLRSAVEGTRYNKLGLRIGIEETYNYPISLQKKSDQILGLRVWVNKQANLGLRLQLEDTKSLKISGLRCLVEETYNYPGSLQKKIDQGLGLRVWVNKETNLGLRLAIPGYNKGKLGTRVGIEDDLYKSFGLRIIPRHTQYLQKGLRVQIDETNYSKVGLKVNVQQTLNNPVGIRIPIEKTSYQTCGLRIYITTIKYIPLGQRILVERPQLQTEELRIGVEREFYNSTGLKALIVKPDIQNLGLKIGIENDSNKDTSIRIPIQTQSYQSLFGNRLGIELPGSPQSLGLRFKIEKPIALPRYLGLRVCVTPSFHYYQRFRIVNSLTVRLGKYFGYCWLEYYDGLKDRIPIIYKVSNMRAEVFHAANDNTYTKVSETIIPQSDRFGKFYIDTLTQFQFNQKYLIRLTINYDEKDVQDVVKDLAFYTTPPRAPLAYMFDPDELGIILEI